MPKLKLSLSAILLLLSFSIHSQTKPQCTFSGTVSDSVTSESLIGVNVYSKREKTGTVTDVAGNYTLTLPQGVDTIEFSFIGYRTKRIVLNVCAENNLEVELAHSETKIDEVKITAQRKFFGNMHYGREISSIDAKQIENENVNNASDILHGKLPGVWATKTSGAPGDHQKIRIRGQSSFFSSAEPLYVVDGVPVPIVNMSSLGIADLNIHDIENVTVLKDASSTALYGFQGGNGVVLIDTKQGGQKEINFSVKTGVQWFNDFYDLYTTPQQITMLDSAYNITKLNPKNAYPKLSDSLCSRDWQDFLFSPGHLQEYQLSGSGTLRKLKYYLSTNYTKHQGIIPESEYERYTFSGRFGRNFGKRITIDLAYRGSYQENKNNQDEYLGNRLIWEGISKSPCLECTPDSITIDDFDRLKPRGLNDYPPINKLELPQDIIERNKHELSIMTNAISGFGRYQIGEHLSVDIMESLMLRSSEYNAEFDYFLFSGNYSSEEKRVDMSSSEDVILLNHQVNLSYYKTFGKHDMNFVLAHRYYKDNLWWQVDSLQGTLDRHFSLKNSMAAYGPRGSVLRNLSSFIVHGSYNYNHKYFLSLVLNLSKVKEGIHTNYYSPFPSVALSWDIAQEQIFKNISWLNHLSLYANWGKSGNYPLNGLANDLYIDVPSETDGYPVYYPSVHQLANHHLKHEETQEINLGIKSNLFHDRLKLMASWYQKNLYNLILQRDIPIFYGGGKMFINVAAIEVKGYEFSIEATAINTSDFEWNLAFNYASTSQQVTKMGEEKKIIFSEPDILIPEFAISEGHGVGDIYGYRYQGKWTEDDWENSYGAYLNRQGGKFLNADTSDLTLNDNDKVALGNSLPDFTWNFNTQLVYKNFAIDMAWYAAWGQEKYNATRAATVMAFTNNEIEPYVMDTLRVIKTNEFYESNIFIEDASFIRLKHITLHYRLNKLLMDRIKLSFSLSFENLLTITSYSGYDPESTIFTDNNFSDNSIDRGAYPNPKAIYASINLKF